MKSQTHWDYVFKIIIIGQSSVGKTSIIRRYVDEQYSENYQVTIGVDHKVKTLEVGDKIVKLQIWDTAGQERFRSLVPNYFNGAHAILLVFDVSSMQSFIGLKYWADVAESHGIALRLLIGNKCDQPHEVPESTARSSYPDMEYFETSALTGERIRDVFNWLAKTLVEQQMQLHSDKNGMDQMPKLELKSNDTGSERYTGNGCCGGTAKK